MRMAIKASLTVDHALCLLCIGARCSVLPVRSVQLTEIHMSNQIDLVARVEEAACGGRDGRCGAGFAACDAGWVSNVRAGVPSARTLRLTTQNQFAFASCTSPALSPLLRS
jgi:hypothetical protein